MKKTVVIRTPTGEEVESSKTSMILKELNRYRHRKRVETAKEFEKRCQEYFEFCGENDIIPTIEMLAAACGTTRQTIFRWFKGTHRDKEWQRIAESAVQTIRAATETAGQEGILSPPIAIFTLKAHGWSDTRPLEALPDYGCGIDTTASGTALLGEYKALYGKGQLPEGNAEEADPEPEDLFVIDEDEETELPEWL